MKRHEVRKACGLPDGAFDIAINGDFLLWGAELVTDLTADGVRNSDPDWAEQVANTMSHVEKLDLVVHWILAFYDQDGLHVEVESDRSFENWTTKEKRRTEESGPCFDCGLTIQWAEPEEGHAEDCPYIIVRFVMMS